MYAFILHSWCVFLYEDARENACWFKGPVFIAMHYVAFIFFGVLFAGYESEYFEVYVSRLYDAFYICLEDIFPLDIERATPKYFNEIWTSWINA